MCHHLADLISIRKTSFSSIRYMYFLKSSRGRLFVRVLSMSPG
jgi:hypothetical protein